MYELDYVTIKFMTSNATLDTVILKAREIRELYNPDDLTPFPYETIKSACDDLVISNMKSDTGDDFPHIQGSIGVFREDSDSPIKYYLLTNPRLTHSATNFIRAKLLAYYFLHKDEMNEEKWIILHELFPGEETKEKEAHVFAVELLMPINLVSQAWLELKNIEKCADIFNVEKDIMRKRLSDLEFI